MKYLLLSIATILFFINQSFAWTYYQKGKSTGELLNKHYTYGKGNPYAPRAKNPNKPYQPVFNPYHKSSFYNNHDKYSTRGENYNNTYQGNVGQQVNDLNSMVNPYGKYGNHFYEKYADHPYQAANASNPYNAYQTPYDPKSVRHNPKYSEQYYDSKGKKLGHGLSNSYKAKSIFNPYTHTPYHYPHAHNPHGENKVSPNQ